MWKQAQSPDERTFGFIFTKIPFTRRSDEEKKDQGAWTRAHTFSLFAPPQKCLAPAATAFIQECIKLIKSDSKDIYKFKEDFYFKQKLFFWTFCLSKNR